MRRPSEFRVFFCGLLLLASAEIATALQDVTADVHVDAHHRQNLSRLVSYVYVRRQWIDRRSIWRDRLSVRDNCRLTNNILES